MPRTKSASRGKKDVPPKPITSQEELAASLGLSTWTVSRAINGHPEVNENTRRRVFAAMEGAKFRPNPLARALRGRSDLIGVCFSDIENPMHTKKLYHLQEFLKQRGLSTFFRLTVEDPENERRVIDEMVRLRVDGIVLVYSTLKDDFRAALNGTPCVLVDPHEPQTLPNISVDRREAMRLLFEHLYGLGHREFVLFGFNRTKPWRWEAIAEAARARGLDPERAFRDVLPPPDIASPIRAGRTMAETVLRWPRRPRAILAVNDRMALGAIQAFKDAGIQVPREISVTGFDNLDFAGALHPTITTIEQNPIRLMERAGEMLMSEIALPRAERGRNVVEKMPTALIEGESTGRVGRG